MSEAYGQPAGGNRSRGPLGLLLSCLRPNTGGRQPQFTASPHSYVSRSRIHSSQPNIALWLLSGSCEPVTGKAEIGLQGSDSQETPENTQPEASFTPYQGTTLLAPQAVHSNGVVNRHKRPQR